MSRTFILRGILWSLVPLAITIFILLLQFDMAYARTHTDTSSHHPITSSPTHLNSLPLAHVARTDLQQGGVISTIQNLFNYIINATVYFPAKTFQEAVEKATRNIFVGQLDQIREPLQAVINVYAFTGAAVFGSVALPAEVQAIGRRLTEAAIPIWVLSLVLLGMAALTQTLSGMGYGTNAIVLEGIRWFFIALASGNGAVLVNQVHNAIGALAYGIASSGGTVGAGEFVSAFIPAVASARVLPLLVLVIGCIIGFIVVIVLAVTYIARYTLLLGITGLAPLAIACEGIPFTRFIFRDWLGMFLRMELLQIVNVTLLVIFKSIGFLAAAHGGGVTQTIMLIAVMLGLASALVGVNLSVFRQVFGSAIEVAGQMRSAGEQLVRVAGVLAGMAMTGGTSAGAIGAVGAASAGGGSVSSASSIGVATSDAASVGTVARPLANAANIPFISNALRGFADGTAASTSNQQRHAASERLAEAQRERETNRARALAREMGATNGDDIDTIASSITQPPPGFSSEQMFRAHRDNADLTRRMAQSSGSPTRAAMANGQGNLRSFGDMAVSMAIERLTPNANPVAQPLADYATQVRAAPVQTWLNAPPQRSDPGGDSLHAYDFGMGAALAREIGSHPSNAPLWAGLSHDLRMAYGERYTQDLLSQVQRDGVSEQQLMQRIDTQLDNQPPLRPVKRFWRNEKASE